MRRLEAAVVPESACRPRHPIQTKSTSKANWDLWKFIPHCECWKAVALSIDIEPPEQIDPYGLNQWTKEFFRRCKIAFTHIDCGRLELSKSGKGNLIVDLSSFGAWARSLNFSLPDQFHSIIEPD